jgi:hypothetical protein
VRRPRLQPKGCAAPEDSAAREPQLEGQAAHAQVGGNRAGAYTLLIGAAGRQTRRTAPLDELSSAHGGGAISHSVHTDARFSRKASAVHPPSLAPRIVAPRAGCEYGIAGLTIARRTRIFAEYLSFGRLRVRLLPLEIIVVVVSAISGLVGILTRWFQSRLRQGSTSPDPNAVGLDIVQPTDVSAEGARLLSAIDSEQRTSVVELAMAMQETPAEVRKELQPLIARGLVQLDKDGRVRITSWRERR